MKRLLLLVLLAVPTSAAAQAALRVEGPAGQASVPRVTHRGFAAYPATALRALGGDVAATAHGGMAILFGDTIRFESFSPFFTASDTVFQLAAPAYREGGGLFLPHQFFAEWLPSRYPDRIAYRGGTLRVTAPAAVAAAPEPAPATSPEPKRTAAEPGVVIIDPGHGGKDPGTRGPNGLREKDVALAIAVRLAEQLRERGYEVHLTRTKDVLVPLMERPRMANRLKAGRPRALFLSIHLNAARNRARGFETFILSEARTEDERRVAEMENAAVAYEENGNGARGLPELDQILNNLRNDFYLRASHALAEVVQKNLATFHPGPDRGVKQAGLVVLVGAFMPAVLVEVGFMSHPQEAALLGTAAFQRKVANALADAVDEFFRTHDWALEVGT